MSESSQYLEYLLRPMTGAGDRSTSNHSIDSFRLKRRSTSSREFSTERSQDKSPPASLPPNMPLQPLPPEIILTISNDLGFFDKHTLGFASHRFRTLIPPPTHAKLLAFEENDWCLACRQRCPPSSRRRPAPRERFRQPGR